MAATDGGYRSANSHPRQRSPGGGWQETGATPPPVSDGDIRFPYHLRATLGATVVPEELAIGDLPSQQAKSFFPSSVSGELGWRDCSDGLSFSVARMNDDVRRRNCGERAASAEPPFSVASVAVGAAAWGLGVCSDGRRATDRRKAPATRSVQGRNVAVSVDAKQGPSEVSSSFATMTSVSLLTVNPTAASRLFVSSIAATTAMVDGDVCRPALQPPPVPTATYGFLTLFSDVGRRRYRSLAMVISHPNKPSHFLPPLFSGELVVAGGSDGLFLLRRRRNDEFDGGLWQRAASAEHPSPL
nr:hypothetical protein Iba_chr07eCG5970 [Ipomoea batatas]